MLSLGYWRSRGNAGYPWWTWTKGTKHFFIAYVFHYLLSKHPRLLNNLLPEKRITLMLIFPQGDTGRPGDVGPPGPRGLPGPQVSITIHTRKRLNVHAWHDCLPFETHREVLEWWVPTARSVYQEHRAKLVSGAPRVMHTWFDVKIFCLLLFLFNHQVIHACD